jgi:GntR family transcriptional regulator
MQIRDIFYERIAAGSWTSREPIPNEFELAKEFEVSIGTLRKAVEILVTEGQLIRKQGRGTFVIDRESPNYVERLDRLRNADGSPIDWLKPTVSHCVDAPDAWERARLKLDEPGARVIRVSRVRRDLRGPLKFERAAAPCARFPESEALLQRLGDIREMAGICNVTIGLATAHIRMAPADEAAARALEVAMGAMLMRIDRVVVDAAGEPIEASVSWLALTDQYFLSVH